ncbi:ABC transporter permease [Chondrinema litorale]|uniref:ABC transporter permease n=1 Tax=Chondrinema litorale TaxID=2994555 RepID=UPI0025428EBB|nr:ABC transporter permease [Chondrinema litorale]UZR93563.1 ABC transporter permease [Chondrinema litorale]
MVFIENVKEAVKSIKDNLLRTSLTAAIIAIGISSLVGILTAVDAIQSSISTGLSDLGANSFDIRDMRYRSRRSQGQRSMRVKDISFREIKLFQERFGEAERISVYASVTGSAEVKYLSKKTNPNSVVAGIDEYYLGNKNYDLEKGRNFSQAELSQGVNVAIIGQDLVKNLFEDEDPINKTIGIRGFKFKIVGILDKSGGLGSGRLDRSVFIPLLNANKFGAQTNLSYTMTTTVKDPSRLDYLIGEATGLMRTIRKDQLGRDNSFEISRSESAAESIAETSNNLRLGGSLIGFITLIGAAIGLMNIMMVSVTERTREIGVRKALGATPTRIREQFLVEAIVICIIGGIVGIMFGMVLGNLVTLLFDDSAFVFPVVWSSIGLVVCVVVGVISGYYPARKASKLDPIESLRYE